MVEGLDISQTRIQELIRDLSHKNEDMRWGAAFALARIGVPAVDLLIPALDDKDSVVRLRAAWALGQIGDQRAVDRLIYTCLLYTSPSPRDRQKSRMPSSA